MFKRILVGVSGGVDSAVTALLLKNKGYVVEGIFMQNWDVIDEQGFCSAQEDYKDACEVCDKLNIPIKSVNFVKQYWNEVFCYLVKEYESGYTPNPDVVCNRYIKFNHFYDYATKILEADAIATGHYARTSFGPFLQHYHPNEAVRLLQAYDTKKDQTLFLSQISQRALQKTMFPLGEMTKQEVKKIAADNGLKKFALKKESMGICFIGTRRFQDFISQYVEDRPGNFVDINSGQVVGQHKGIHQWTLGQRAKLSGYSCAYFTVAKDVEKNIIYVIQGTEHPALYSALMFTNKPHWIHSKPDLLKSGSILKCGFKFQQIESVTDCAVCETDKGLIIKLPKIKRSLTPGQYATLYKDGECLGSAKIMWAITDFNLNWSKYYQMAKSGQTNIPDNFKKYAVSDEVFDDENSAMKTKIKHSSGDS